MEDIFCTNFLSFMFVCDCRVVSNDAAVWGKMHAALMLMCFYTQRESKTYGLPH